MLDPDKKKAAVGPAAGVVALLSTAGIAFGIDPETMNFTLQTLAGNQIAQAGFFFSVAAWIHSGRVKKEISKNFTSVTEAINNVASALRTDLEGQKKILEKLDRRVKTLEDKVIL